MSSHEAPPPGCTIIQPSAQGIGLPKLLPLARRRTCVPPVNAYMVWVAIMVEATHSVTDTSTCSPNPVRSRAEQGYRCDCRAVQPAFILGLEPSVLQRLLSLERR